MFRNFVNSIRSLSVSEKIATLLVIIFSIGGTFAAVILSSLSVVPDAGSFFYGQIAASFSLAYLAWIKPKKDIVSLTAPIYAVRIFMGIGISPNFILQILFSVTLLVLLVRLHRKFGSG